MVRARRRHENCTGIEEIRGIFYSPGEHHLRIFFCSLRMKLLINISQSLAKSPRAVILSQSHLIRFSGIVLSREPEMSRYVRICLKKILSLARSCCRKYYCSNKVFFYETTLHAMKQKKQPGTVSSVSDTKIKYCKFCGRCHDQRNCLHFVESMRIVRKSHYLSFQPKARCLQFRKSST